MVSEIEEETCLRPTRDREIEELGRMKINERENLKISSHEYGHRETRDYHHHL